MTRRPVILVLRALGLGDFATGVPALRGLRRAYPDHEIVLAAPGALRPLAAATGAVDRVVDVASGVRRPVTEITWPGPPPELAVNLHGRGPHSHRALRTLRPSGLLGFRCAAAGFSHGPEWAVEHEVARWCRMLAWYGIDCFASDLALAPPQPSPRPSPQPSPQAPPLADRVGPDPAVAGAVVIHPGASRPDRCWPVARFAAVAAALAADGHRIVVTGSPGAEERVARTLVRLARLPQESVVAGRTDLAALAAVVCAAGVVICGDTGVAHLATAYRTPSVVLFGPVSPAEWGPPTDRPRHVTLWLGPYGLPRITPGEVLTAARAVLRTPDRRRGSCQLPGWLFYS